MPTVLTVPGLNGSPADHWQTHLERAWGDAVRVEQADWAAPDRHRWLDRLVAAVAAHPDCILVAHSLGCALVAHLVRAWPEAPVAGALLVAPADVEGRAAMIPSFRSFVPLPLMPIPFPSVVVASRTDPYVPFQRAVAFARAWTSDLVDLGVAGHINIDSGFGRWPGGERMLSNLAARTARSDSSGADGALRAQTARR